MQQSHAKLPVNPPFFYGWVIVGCAISVGIPRAILGASILGALIGPMSDDLGWNRTTISGVLTTGALVATVTAPVAGRLVDRYGSRVILSGSSLLMGAFALLLSYTVTPLMFYIPFTLGRALFVGPMEVGMSTTVSNWFIRRRPQALAAVSATSPIGLAIFPPMAGAIAAAADWRTAWLALGMCMLVIGVIPSAIFIRRRPEDVGLLPDGDAALPPPGEATTGATKPASATETNFTLRQAMRTPALWLIMGTSATTFMFHGGVSLHHIPHFIQRGFDPLVAASMASAYAISLGLSSFLWGAVARRIPLRAGMALSSLMLTASGLVMVQASSVPIALVSVCLFGLGLSGMFVVVPSAWADYYGRRSLGAIRGVTLTAQTGGAAIGPVLTGGLYDILGDYRIAFAALALACLVGAIMAGSASRPRLPHNTEDASLVPSPS